MITMLSTRLDPRAEHGRDRCYEPAARPGGRGCNLVPARVDGPVVSLAAVDEAVRYCPEWSTRACSSKGRCTTRLRDLIVGGRHVRLGSPVNGNTTTSGAAR